MGDVIISLVKFIGVASCILLFLYMFIVLPIRLVHALIRKLNRG